MHPIKVTTKKGLPAEKIDVILLDDTAEATLTLWGCHTPSAAFWQPSQTVLLLTNPGFKQEGCSGRRPTILLTSSTHVDVDPFITDADWLRSHVQRLTKREHVNQPFPENGKLKTFTKVGPEMTKNDKANERAVIVFDIGEAASSEVRILFTLADIDEL